MDPLKTVTKDLHLPAIKTSSSSANISTKPARTPEASQNGDRRILIRSVSDADSLRSSASQNSSMTEEKVLVRSKKKSKVNVKEEVKKAHKSIDRQQMIIGQKHSKQCDAMELRLAEIKKKTDKMIAKCIRSLVNKQYGGAGEELKSQYQYMKQGKEARLTHVRNIAKVNETRVGRMQNLEQKVAALEQEIM